MVDDISHVFAVDFEVVPNFLHIVEMHKYEFRVFAVVPLESPWVAFYSVNYILKGKCPKCRAKR